MSAANAVVFSGLVSLPTSGNTPTETPKKIEIETRLNRWKKLRKAIREGARLHSLATGRRRALMITFTYEGVDDQQPCDLSNCLRHMRQWCHRKSVDFRYVWVAELQGRGALHYHLIVWLPRHLMMPCPDKQGWWPHGSTNVTAARSGVGYMTKYASKLRSKLKDGVSFPKGYRMHGCGGLPDDHREFRSHFLRPQWLRDLTKYTDKIRPAPGGGFVSKITGELFPSPWILCGFRFVPGVGPVVTVRKKGD